MSQVFVDTVKSRDGSTGPNLVGITTVTGNFNVTGVSTISNITMPNAGTMSNRNLIHNGEMQVSQRGITTTGQSASSYMTADRWAYNITNLGTWTVETDPDSPVGFTSSLTATCTTADASPDAGDYILLYQSIEAQNLQHLAFGDAAAEQLVLSFWVKSNKTGDASFEILQVDNSNKLFSAEYNISTADTWEYKTISVPADTAGVINNDDGTGFQVGWWLNTGSTYTTGSPQSTWATLANENRNPSNLGVGGAISDYFSITGVQLEVGSVATPFEHRSYADMLAICQRYFVALGGRSDFTPANNYDFIGHGRVSTVTSAIVDLHLPVTLRTIPSMSFVGTIFINSPAGQSAWSSVASIYSGFSRRVFLAINVSGSHTANQPCHSYVGNTASDKFFISADL